jgi:hypothetical protein
MTRERLHNRRRQITDCVRWPLDAGRRIHVSAGFAGDGRILEAFLRGGGRSGSDVDFLLDDLAVLLSRDLQHGDRLAKIASGLGRLPDGKPSSIVGAVVDRLLSIEANEP